MADLVEECRPGDLVVVNDTRVLPARLRLSRASGAGIEALVLEPAPDAGRGGGCWEALLRPSRRVRVGDVLGTGDGAAAAVAEADLGEGRWLLRWCFDSAEVDAAEPGDDRARLGAGSATPTVEHVVAFLERHGDVPLPPYLTEGIGDPERYQTVYARRPASAAAPTAGLHLTEALLDKLSSSGVQVARLELVVGLGTFRPISANRVEDHAMHTEAYRIPPATIRALEEMCRPRAGGGPVPGARTGAGPGRGHHRRAGTRVVGGHRCRRRPHRPVHPARRRTAGGRPAPDELPRAPVVVAGADRRVRRSSLAGAVRGGARPRLPVPVPRGRHAPPAHTGGGVRGRNLRGASVSGRLQLTVEGVDGDARATTVQTTRGVLRTPAFMPVGTRGAVRTLDAADLEAVGAQVVLGNTYHLMLRPGADVVAELGGLHRFTGWSGHLLTDSGGYQIFSLAPSVDEEGATFASTYDGSAHRLTPELAVDVQARLGADIQMVLDVCPALPAPHAVVEAATERTHRWAARARAAFLDHPGVPPHQVQFGIVQGGTSERLRSRSATRLVEVGFDGYGIGGLSVGETRAEMVPALAAATGELPADRLRYLMGVGDPAGIVEAVARGVDLFDCVLPTRLARHGTVLTSGGRLNLRNARFARDDDPLDPEEPCPLLTRYSRGYLRHLLAVHELSALRLITLQNLWWLLRLVERLRAAILGGTFAQVRHQVLDVWGG